MTQSRFSVCATTCILVHLVVFSVQSFLAVHNSSSIHVDSLLSLVRLISLTPNTSREFSTPLGVTTPKFHPTPRLPLLITHLPAHRRCWMLLLQYFCEVWIPVITTPLRQTLEAYPGLTLPWARHPTPSYQILENTLNTALMSIRNANHSLHTSNSTHTYIQFLFNSSTLGCISNNQCNLHHNPNHNPKPDHNCNWLKNEWHHGRWVKISWRCRHVVICALLNASHCISVIATEMKQ